MIGIAVVVIVILLIIAYWYTRDTSPPRDPVEEQFASAYDKLARLYAYDGYQGYLLDKCRAQAPTATPEDQAKLISIRETRATMRQDIDDLGGALIDIYSMPGSIERVAIIHSALDSLWHMQCAADKALMNLKSFQFVRPHTW